MFISDLLRFTSVLRVVVGLVMVVAAAAEALDQ